VRRRRIAAWAAGALALLLAWQLASALSSSGATASARTWLTDGAQGKALFPAGVLFAPGQSRAACLSVQGGDAGPDDVVTLQASDVSGPLANRLRMTVSVGTGTCAAFSGRQVFSGTLNQLAATPVDTGWAPGVSQQRLFRFVATLPAEETQQGAASGASFIWQLTQTATPATPVTPAPSPTTPSPTAPRPTTPPVTQPTSPSTKPTTEPTPSTKAPEGESFTPGPVNGDNGITPTEVPEMVDDPVDDVGTSNPTSVAVPLPQGPFTGESPQDEGKADVSLVRSTPKKLAATLASAVQDEPGLLLWPLIVAGLFMIGQYWIDRYDPKLAQASRTQKDLSVIFPVRYGAEGSQP
jgi:hypothetical protein